MSTVIEYETLDELLAATPNEGDYGRVSGGTAYGVYTASGWKRARSIGGAAVDSDASADDPVVGSDSRLQCGRGLVDLDFGAFPGKNTASFQVTGQVGILPQHNISARIVAVAVSTVNGTITAEEAAYLSTLITLTCDLPVKDSGFNVYAVTSYKLQGPVKVAWYWGI